MPFLFPALAAGICDIGILYLGHQSILLEREYDGSDYYDVEEDNSKVYRYKYLVWLAAIRVFLLLIPLPYHSFLGKALKCPIVYRLFYGMTLVTILVHSLTLLMMDPSSLSSLLQAISNNTNGTNLHHVLVTRSLWVAILLTLVSTLSHIALFFHVRSTAPNDTEWIGQNTKRRPRVLLYYAKEKNLQLGLETKLGGNATSTTTTTTTANCHQDLSEREGLLNGNHDQLPTNGSTTASRLPSFQSGGVHSSSSRALKEISNKIMMELQVRLRKAKGEWTKRLEEYQKPLRAAALNPEKHSYYLSLTNNLTPFRVILELFASDDNAFDTQQLDAVYDRDEGAALMLFVPQLLSFLLHGAYESSHMLEEWILNACQKNLFFAHKCYWFLRAWSLEHTNSSSLASEMDLQQQQHQSQQQHHHQQQQQQQPITRLSHSSSLNSFATQEDESHNGSKLLPEERAVIEELMRKIMKCGEEPARDLHFGASVGASSSTSTTKTSNNGESPATITTTTNATTTLFPSENIKHYLSLTPSSAANKALIPVNPTSGLPSRKHFDCLAAKNRHGFLPLDNGDAITASYQQSILNGNPGGTSYFDSCPVFMDALITIADNLFKVPRDMRKVEFKKQLKLLEVEALPCNEIYIPLQDLHHRVWRIVAEESIPLSTKERVPCIVCLEVLGYTPEPTPDDRSIGNLLQRRSLTLQNSVSEREMVETWRNAPRDPYRRETALNRVTHEMNKLPDKMKESMQEMQLSMEEMKLSIRQGISHIRETADGIQHHNEIFWSAQNTPERNGSHYQDNNSSSNNKTPTIDPESPKPYMDGQELKSFKTTTQPLTPKTPHSTITQGAMGQWTKSPAPKGILAPTPTTTTTTTSPLRVLEIPDAGTPDLSAPSMKSKYNSYQTKNSTTTTSTSSTTTTNGRFSKSNPFSSRVNNFDLEMNGAYSKDYDDDDDDDEHDYYDAQESSGNHGAMVPPSFNGHSKPPVNPSRPPPVVFKENWKEKEDRLRSSSAFGNHPGWKLLPVLVKSNDDLRQEQLASQLIQRMALILARDQIPVWLCPYEILALDANGGIIEAIPDTISLNSLKRNDPEYTDLKGFFEQYFFEADALADAKANFCESLAAYSIVCFLLQIKDRHNGNILLDNRGHLIHIDFGFFFLSSPGKNTGFESAPFKLTREFVNILGGPDSHLFGVFRTLCYRTFLSLRKHCHEIILLVEMLQLGNEDLACFRGRPEDAIRELRQRFRLDLNDRACLEYVNALIDESLENWRTNWYDRYQRYCVGVL